MRPNKDVWRKMWLPLVGFARSYPQTAYGVLVMLIQKELQFVQNINPRVEPLFVPLEVVLRENFLQAFLWESMS